jgi:hypothetical protein
MSEEEAESFSSFLTPMLHLYGERRAAAASMVNHPWLGGVVVQGELEVMERKNSSDANANANANGTGVAALAGAGAGAGTSSSLVGSLGKSMSGGATSGMGFLKEKMGLGHATGASGGGANGPKKTSGFSIKKGSK